MFKNPDAFGFFKETLCCEISKKGSYKVIGEKNNGTYSTLLDPLFKGIRKDVSAV